MLCCRSLIAQNHEKGEVVLKRMEDGLQENGVCTECAQSC